MTTPGSDSASLDLLARALPNPAEMAQRVRALTALVRATENALVDGEPHGTERALVTLTSIFAGLVLLSMELDQAVTLTGSRSA